MEEMKGRKTKFLARTDFRLTGPRPADVGRGAPLRIRARARIQVS
jgi:hypothetical protein